MDMPGGPWFWLNYMITTLPRMRQPDYDPIQPSFRDMVASTNNAEGLTLFIKDANYGQNLCQPSLHMKNYRRLRRSTSPITSLLTTREADHLTRGSGLCNFVVTGDLC